MSLVIPEFSLSCLCYVTLVPSEYLHSIQPWSFAWGPAPTPSLHSLQVDTSGWATSQLETDVPHDLCDESSPFCLVVLPSEVSRLPLNPPVRGFPTVWKILLLQKSLPGTGPHPEILCLPFCLYLLSYLIPRRLVCLSGCLGSSASFRRCSAGTVQHEDDLLIIHPNRVWLQDGRGMGQGGYLLPHKYIKMSSASRGTPTSRKANHSPWNEVGQKIKTKRETKDYRTGTCHREWVLKENFPRNRKSYHRWLCGEPRNFRQKYNEANRWH